MQKLKPRRRATCGRGQKNILFHSLIRISDIYKPSFSLKTISPGFTHS